MLLGVYQLIFAKQGEFNVYREYIEALRDYWIARSDLERAVGTRLVAPTRVCPLGRPLNQRKSIPQWLRPPRRRLRQRVTRMNQQATRMQRIANEPSLIFSPGAPSPPMAHRDLGRLHVDAS